MWKLLTGAIADQIYPHLGQEKLLPAIYDLLYIDRAVIKEIKSRNKNL